MISITIVRKPLLLIKSIELSVVINELTVKPELLELLLCQKAQHFQPLK